MGRGFILLVFFLFLNLRGNKIYIRKKLLGFGWIPLDPGNKRWKRRVGAVTAQSIAFSLASVLYLEKAEKTELEGKGLGLVLQSGNTEELKHTPPSKSYTV